MNLTLPRSSAVSYGHRTHLSLNFVRRTRLHLSQIILRTSVYDGLRWVAS